MYWYQANENGEVVAVVQSDQSPEHANQKGFAEPQDLLLKIVNLETWEVIGAVPEGAIS